VPPAIPALREFSADYLRFCRDRGELATAAMATLSAAKPAGSGEVVARGARGISPTTLIATLTAVAVSLPGEALRARTFVDGGRPLKGPVQCGGQ
jgi:hypothetical protein